MRLRMKNYGGSLRNPICRGRFMKNQCIVEATGKGEVGQNGQSLMEGGGVGAGNIGGLNRGVRTPLSTMTFALQSFFSTKMYK